MSYTPQTEAQRLADWLDADACDLLTPREAAAELRRLDAENDTLHKTIDCLTAQLRDYAGLKAARLAYASEFCFDKDDEPDVGSIHRNIRLLKAERDQLRAQLAKAVAEEREACAKVCEYQADRFMQASPLEGNKPYASHECAAAIRARGNT